MGYDTDALQGMTASRPPKGPSTSPAPVPTGLSAMTKDHSVAPGEPVPTMTDEIRQWCDENNACRSCRVKNAKHRSADCP
eukprot:3277583-Rhodomonas_salina.1